MYRDGFADWEDVQDAYEMQEPEPEQVILAAYDVGSYEGSSEVIYRNGEDYFVVSGGHCSCYGLEGQWEPEKYDLATLKAAYGKMSSYDALSEQTKAIVAAL